MINVDIIQQLRNCTHIALSAHISPDGDAIGACIALALALEKMNKKPIILIDEYPKKYDFLPGKEFVYKEYPNNTQLDLFIALDCGDVGRLGEYTSYFEKSPITINIDHHISNPKYGDYYFVDSGASSTCEIVYRIIKACEIDIDNKIAVCLYTGIAFDTGGFKHSNTSTSTHQIISDLIKYNIDFSDIMDKLFYTRSLESSKLLGHVLTKMEVLQDKQLCVCSLAIEEIEGVGATINDVEGIISFMKNIEEVLIAVLLYEKSKDEIKVSFRSSGDKDVCCIAQSFQGGGHKKAAGCTLNMRLEEAKKQIIDKIQKELF